MSQTALLQMHNNVNKSKNRISYGHIYIYLYIYVYTDRYACRYIYIYILLKSAHLPERHHHFVMFVVKHYVVMSRLLGLFGLQDV